MPAADLQPDEEARLKALRELEILDTDPEAEFADLVRRAAEATGAPIAVITLVDEARQWFKARVNLELESTDSDLSFCAHAILTPDDLTVVPDTREDERFADNLLVADGSVLPTQGAANPALAIMALSDRLARLLAEKRVH